MLCDICGKNPATVHLTEIIDDQMTELHLCEGCARQKSNEMEQQFGLSDLLAGLAESNKPDLEKETAGLKCPNCGLTYADFKKIGRLGCSKCYTAFRKYLGYLLKRIHGSSLHFGKQPVLLKGVLEDKDIKAPKKKIDVASLREALAKAIETEAFEEAAKIRDQIKELEKRQGQDS